MAKKTSKKTKTIARRLSTAAKTVIPIDQIDPRKKLLSRVAGAVAAGIVGSPSPSISTAEGIATVAVDIAEQILTRAGVAAPVAPAPAEVLSLTDAPDTFAS